MKNLVSFTSVPGNRRVHHPHSSPANATFRQSKHPAYAHISMCLKKAQGTVHTTVGGVAFPFLTNLCTFAETKTPSQSKPSHESTGCLFLIGWCNTGHCTHNYTGPAQYQNEISGTLQAVQSLQLGYSKFQPSVWCDVACIGLSQLS